MSARDRGSLRAPDRNRGADLNRAARVPQSPANPSLGEQFSAASPAHRALVPIRFFFGLTFVYAGLDKFLDPTFFNPSAPTSITAQLQAFARVSPLAFMIKPTEPLAVPIGALIALAELAIGLGALSGLAFRLAAAGGAALSFLFFLTASWATHPYYFGADLPYAFGWLTLALAGTGGLFVPAFVGRLGTDEDAAIRRHGPAGVSAPAAFRPPRELDLAPSESRRLLVQTGVLGAASVILAGLTLPVRFLRSDDAAAASAAGSAGLAASSAAPAASVAPAGVVASAVPGGPTSAPRATVAAAAAPNALTVATTAQVDQQGAVRITVPASAPSSLPAGDPALVVKLKSGGYACFDAICTHAGCRVGWDPQNDIMLCPCHGAAYDPNNHAAVLQGPAPQPLLELPIVVDKATGTITLKA